MGNVSLTLDEYHELTNRHRDAEQRCVALESQLIATRLEDPNGRVRELASLSRSLINTLRFAIANLPPEEIPNWPTVSLRAIALAMKHLPDFNTDDQSLIVELLAFADEADRADRDRPARRPEPPTPTVNTQDEVASSR